MKPDGLKPALLVLLVFLVSAAYYWQGLGPLGDAERYVRYAMRWRETGPFLGDTHWALRHLFVLPMALFFFLFGSNEFTATLPNIIYSAGLVFLTFYFARRYLSLAEAVLAATLVATSAFFVSKPMEIAVYGPEAFFCALGCWLYVAAEQERRRLLLLASAGAAIGLAWTIREQTLAMMAAFAVLALVSRRQILLTWAALGVGFGSVLAAEWIVYAIAAGDPFYRYKIDLNHRVSGWGAAKPMYAPLWQRAITPVKDIFSDPLTTPVLAIGVVLAALARGAGMFADKRAVKPIFVFGVVSLVCVPIAAVGFNLALPRYYPIFPYFVVLLCAFSIAALRRKYGFRMGAAAMSAILFTNAASEEFTSYKEYSEARIFVRHVEAADEPVFTDPLTAFRARHLLLMKRWSRDEISRRVRSDLNAPPGVLYFKANTIKKIEVSGCVISSQEPPRGNWMHSLIRRSGASDFLGSKVRKIVEKPNAVSLIRLDRNPDGAPCAPDAPEGD